MSSFQREPSLRRSALSVVAGYAVLMALVMAFFAVGAAALDLSANEPPPAAFLVSSVLAGFGAAAAAGWVTATVARRRALAHGLCLVAFTAPLALVNAVLSDLREPVWYRASNVLALVGGVVLGAWLRGRPEQRSAS